MLGILCRIIQENIIKSLKFSFQRKLDMENTQQKEGKVASNYTCIVLTIFKKGMSVCKETKTGNILNMPKVKWK